MIPSSVVPYPDLGILVAVWGVVLVLGIGSYLWYAFMLSKVFARLGADSWKGWVPVLNEAEIFRLGGVPSWSVVFLVLPVVALYGLYLKVVAVARINAHFGRGVGATVLAVVLPPVWATLLAQNTGSVDPALEERIAPSVASRSGY
ncbi:DUF5684 domain-containing protein, partial [Pseudolysinimonas sp.]|uniref:DUF5684 domain-containing protein n=1 Tax=Pseudolysinimonas sp. TaxID=2680009 RepID=UPI003783E83D